MSPKNKEHTSEISSCFKLGAKNLWLVGIGAVALITIFSTAMFRPQQSTGQQIEARKSSNTSRQIPSQQPIQYAPQASQQAPYSTRGTSPVTCPFCGFYVSNPIIAPNGTMTCPNCARNIILSSPSGGAFARRPGNNAYPNYAQGFTPGQQVAFTKPGAPPITRNAVLPHAFRGVCSNCHQILETQAKIGTMR